MLLKAGKEELQFDYSTHGERQVLTLFCIRIEEVGGQKHSRKP
jgi:hypothetical protein